MKYASIVPLIGGETIAMQNVFGNKPDYILSYTPFENNDKQLLEYYNNEVPYHLLDQGDLQNKSVDVVNAVCPCAGLSSLSPSSRSDSTTNDWMITSAKYVLEEIKPAVFWGENAPRLASKMGAPIVHQMRKLARENGYTLSIYKTKSLLHGLSQVRDRTFYFFWKGNKIPVFEYYKRPFTRIEDQIRSSKHDDIVNDLMWNSPTNLQKPTDNPYYQYILEEMHGGITHMDFFNMIEKSTNPLVYIEANKIKYTEVAKWMRANGHDSIAQKCKRMQDKLDNGGNLMRKMTEIGKGHIGAFVGHFVTTLTHPDENRYINTREALDIMKMPKDFILHGGRRNLNMIAQNVPVSTAMDMATNIKNFLGGNIDTIEAPYAVQDNKAQTFWSEYEPSTLDGFM